MDDIPTTENTVGQSDLDELLAQIGENESTGTRNQFVDLDSEQLNAFRLDQENPGTIRKTMAHVTVFTDFLKLKGELRPPHLIPPNELDPLLGNFFVSVRKSSGREYEPCYLKNIQNSLERHLKNRGYEVSLTSGRAFHTSREMLKAKQINLKKQGFGNRPKAASAITNDEVDLLWGTGQLGGGNPESLLQTMWWLNTTQFGMRAGSKEHLAMCWGDVTLKQTSDGTEYLERVTERQTKTRPGSDPDNIRQINPRAYATNDDRCPVMHYKLYRDKRPTDMCKESDPFYLGTMHNPRSGQNWFRRQRLGPNKLQTFMTKMTKSAGIQTDSRLTNTSARKYQVQTLNDQGVPPTHIQQLTGHKNIQSINKYSTLNNNQKELYSLTLSRPNTANPILKRPALTDTEQHPQTISKYAKHSTMTATSTSSEMCQNDLSYPRPASMSAPLHMFDNATITGGTINITIRPPGSPTSMNTRYSMVQSSETSIVQPGARVNNHVDDVQPE